MVIRQVCSTIIIGTLLAGTAFMTTSCSSYTGSPLGTNAEAAAATEATTPVPQPVVKTRNSSDRIPAAQNTAKGVRTNHDIFHSKGLEVPAGTPVPAVTVRVDADPVEGWNLYVGTANFTFEPTKVDGESRPSEGHAYLYINDKPIQRIYSRWTHLPTLPGGENIVRVTLNANGHETLTTQNEPIEDSVTIDVYDPSAE
ncbi:MAG: hypothetical protein AAF810_02560 [Cyanobacteria bacterium P01_D01_bin.36]